MKKLLGVILVEIIIIVWILSLIIGTINDGYFKGIIVPLIIVVLIWALLSLIQWLLTSASKK